MLSKEFSVPPTYRILPLLPESWRELGKKGIDILEAKKSLSEAQTSALTLTEILLNYPHNSVLQQAPEGRLPDGRTLHVRLINTGNFFSLKDLIKAKNRADRIEVNIRDEKGGQFGYHVSWHIAREPRIGDYREYIGGVQAAAVFNSSVLINNEGHAAYIGHREMEFGQTQQRSVYMRCKEIFDIAIASLTVKPIQLP